MARANRDHIDTFHSSGLYVPTRTIVLEDEVDTKSAGAFLRNLHILEHLSLDPITVLLNTDGGCVGNGFAIYDAIKASECHVTIKVVGSAQSMGCVILQAGDTRVVAKNSTVMFHTGFVVMGSYNPDEAVEDAKYTLKQGRRADTVVFEALKTKTPGLTRSKFNAWCSKSRRLFAEEAVALGLADSIA